VRLVVEKTTCSSSGPRGVGKATLAVALALKVVHAGYRVYYIAAVDLIDRTAKVVRLGTLVGHRALLEWAAASRDR
jgi:DNA replication protein DnaC